MERRRRNARARERYRQLRLTEGTRVDRRIGMHALAIQVDPIAYREVKAEALKRGSTIPTVIGEILSDSSSRQPIASAEATGPRWRRTGEGRKANQHTRIDIGDEGWLTVRRDAVRHGLTIACWIGLNVETWAQHRDVSRRPLAESALDAPASRRAITEPASPIGTYSGMRNEGERQRPL